MGMGGSGDELCEELLKEFAECFPTTSRLHRIPHVSYCPLWAIAPMQVWREINITSIDSHAAKRSSGYAIDAAILGQKLLA